MCESAETCLTGVQEVCVVGRLRNIHHGVVSIIHLCHHDDVVFKMSMSTMSDHFVGFSL